MIYNTAYTYKFQLKTTHVVRVIEQCCFNSTPDPFNGQTANFILKPPKVFESRTYVKKANLECYRKNTVLLLWRHVHRGATGEERAPKPGKTPTASQVCPHVCRNRRGTLKRPRLTIAPLDFQTILRL